MNTNRPDRGGSRHRRTLPLQTAVRPAPSRPLLSAATFAALFLPAILPFSAALGTHSASTLAAGEPRAVLEQIDYRRNEQIEQAVGEVQIAGNRVRLRLFSEQLATHYDIWVSVEDFLGATPLDPELNNATLETRAAQIAAHKIEREEARRVRIEKRRLEEEKEQKSRRWDGSASAASRRRSGDSGAEQVSPLVSTADLTQLAGELEARRKIAIERSRQLLNDIAPRLRVARVQKVSTRRIAAAVEDAESALGEIGSGIKARNKAIARVERDVAGGAIKGIELREHLATVARRYANIEKQLNGIEKDLERQALSLVSLPEEPTELVEPVETVRREVESPSSPRSTHAGRVAEATMSLEGGAPSPAITRSSESGSESFEFSEVTRPAVEPDSAAPRNAASQEAASEKSATEREENESASDEGPSDEGPSDEGPGDEGPADTGGGGLPVWPLYPIALLGCFFLWRGQRRPRE